jgi:hypothetical protein
MPLRSLGRPTTNPSRGKIAVSKDSRYAKEGAKRNGIARHRLPLTRARAIVNDMHRLRPPPPSLALFALLSLALHVAAAGALQRATRSGRAFEARADRTTALAGETLDVEPPATATPDDEVSEPATESPSPGTASSPSRPSSSAPDPRASAPAGRARTVAANGAPAAAPPPLFGAVGERTATDLATTFTRAFNQAASADPIWASVPVGSAGTAEVTLLLGDDGHLVQHAVSGSPSVALRRGIERTIGLLGARPFTARGEATRLRIVCHVSRNDVHDGLHGDVFALSGGSFSGDEGTVWFALPASSGGGRRVDTVLRLLAAP